MNAVSKLIKDVTNRLVYVTGPVSKSWSTIAGGGKDLLAVIDAKEKSEVKPYEEKVVASTLLKNEPKPGKVVFKKTDAKLGTTELKLSNGVTVTLKPTDYKNDQILLNSVRAGGKNHYGVKDKYSAEYATAIVGAMGVGDFSPTDLRKVLAGKTASARPTFDAISEGVVGN